MFNRSLIFPSESVRELILSGCVTQYLQNYSAFSNGYKPRSSVKMAALASAFKLIQTPGINKESLKDENKHFLDLTFK